MRYSLSKIGMKYARKACSCQKYTAEKVKISPRDGFPQAAAHMCRNVCTRDTWFFFHVTNFKFLFWLRNVIHTATSVHKHGSAGVQEQPSWWDGEDNTLHSFSSVIDWMVFCITAAQPYLNCCQSFSGWNAGTRADWGKWRSRTAWGRATGFVRSSGPALEIWS